MNRNQKNIIAYLVKSETSANSKKLSFVLSSEKVDRAGDIIRADGWVLDNFKNNPVALYQHDSNRPIGIWENIRVEGKKLIADLILAPASVGGLQRAVIELIKGGFLKAVSVGFMPIKSTPIDKKKPWRGSIYSKQELTEASLVSVPANPEALRIAKSFHLTPDDMDALFNESVNPIAAHIAKHKAASGRQQSNSNTFKKMNISEKIQEKQTMLVALNDDMATKSAEYAENPTDDGAELISELDAQVEAVTKELDVLVKAEKSMLKAQAFASQSNTRNTNEDLDYSNDDHHPAIAKAKHKAEDYFFQPIAVALKAHQNKVNIEQLIETEFANDSEMREVSKAVARPASTDQTGWAQELVQAGAVAFQDLLKGVSVYPVIAGLGQADMPFNVPLPSRDPAAGKKLSGAFIAQGAPIPVKEMAFLSTQLLNHKLGILSVFTRELAQQSVPSIQALIRQAMLDDTAEVLDTLLLDANAGTTVRPAGLGNGVSEITSAGATAANVLTDIKAIIGPLMTANQSLNNIVIAMNPLHQLGLASITNAVGLPAFPEVASGRLGTMRLVTSTHIPTGKVYAINCAYFASGNMTPEFMFSDTATLHMEDTAPAAVVSGPVGTEVPATPVRSLFQTDTTSLRMIWQLSWVMRQTNAVQILNTVAW